MLLVKTFIGKSAIAGIGLFSAEFIPKGTVIWRYKERFDLKFPESYPETLPEVAREYFLTYAYQNPKTRKYVLCSDNCRFTNHSESANMVCVEDTDDEETMDIAARDILAGEELTDDYREFDADPYYGFAPSKVSLSKKRLQGSRI